MLSFIASANTLPRKRLKTFKPETYTARTSAFLDRAKYQLLNTVSSIRHDLFVHRTCFAVLQDGVQRLGVTSESAGGKQRVVRWDNLYQTVTRICVAVLCGSHMLLASGDQVQPREFIARHQALDFVKNRHGIKWAQPRLKIVGGKPNCMTISLSGLRSASLAHIGTYTTAERNQLANVRSHALGNPHNDFKFAADASHIACLFQ